MSKKSWALTAPHLISIWWSQDQQIRHVRFGICVTSRPSYSAFAVTPRTSITYVSQRCRVISSHHLATTAESWCGTCLASISHKPKKKKPTAHQSSSLSTVDTQIASQISHGTATRNWCWPRPRMITSYRFGRWPMSNITNSENKNNDWFYDAINNEKEAI